MPTKVEIFDNLLESYSKHPDQGLKLCKKKLQKDPSNNIYLVAQASFLCDLGRPQDALANCEAVKSSSKEPLEPGLIVTLQDIVKACQEELGTFTGVGGPKISALWKDALDNCPRQWLKDTRKEMLTSTLRVQFYDVTQQLFARLQREFPQNSKFHFAWIALCQLQADKLPEHDRTAVSFKMLGSRSLKAAVDNTLAGKETGRKMTSSSELRLLCQVYSRQNMLDDLLSVLDSSEIGIESEIAKNDVEFVLEKLAALTKMKRWRELRKLCLDGLKKLYLFYQKAEQVTFDVPNEIAWAIGWQPWQIALNATVKDSEAGLAEEVLQLAEQFLELDPQHRNAGNARMLYHYLFNKDALIESAMHFFDMHKSKVSCFDDLRQVMEGLDRSIAVKFCDHLTWLSNVAPLDDITEKQALQRLTALINSLKLRYCLYFSQIGPDDATELVTFVAECLDVYTLMSQQPDGPSDDACALAIAALMKLGTTASNIYNLQAACLIQILRDNSQRNYEATLMQLLNARTLGLGSLGFAAFRDLSLREVQFDTLSHLFFTRISTLHPHQVFLRDFKALEDRHRDPREAVRFALNFPRRAMDDALNTLCKDLENIYFDKLYEFLSFRQRISRSFTTTASKIELQRMYRLTGADPLPSTIASTFDFSPADNRDYKCVQALEPSKSIPSFEEIAISGPKPGVYWLVRWQLNETAQAILSPAQKRSTLTESEDRVLDQLFEFLAKNKSFENTEMTKNERDVCQRWDILISIVIWFVLGPKHPHASKAIKKEVASLKEQLSAAALTLKTQELDMADEEGGSDEARLDFTHSSELESWFLHLEFAKACVQLATTGASLLKQKGHHSSDSVSNAEMTGIANEARRLGEVVQQQADGLRDSLKRTGRQKVWTAVRGGGLGVVLEKLAGGEQLRRYVDEMVDSALDGLDGVLKVKVG